MHSLEYSLRLYLDQGPGEGFVDGQEKEREKIKSEPLDPFTFSSTKSFNSNTLNVLNIHFCFLFLCFFFDFLIWKLL